MLSSNINNHRLFNLTQIAQSSCKCSYTAFCPDAQATPSDLQRQLQLAVYFYQ